MPTPTLQAQYRAPQRTLLLNATVLFGLAGVSVALLLTADLAAWKRALLAFGALYFPYVFLNRRAALLNPPRLDAHGLFLYRKPDLDYLLHPQQVPWANVRHVQEDRSGVLWVHHVTAAGQARRDPIATRTFRNADAFRAATLEAARAHGVTGA